MCIIYVILILFKGFQNAEINFIIIYILDININYFKYNRFKLCDVIMHLIIL